MRESTHFTPTDALLVAMATIWGANFAVVKYATTVLNPLAFNAVRVSIAALSMGLVTAVLRTPESRSLRRRDVPVLLALGVLGNGLYQLGFVEGIARSRAGDAALVFAASPAMTALLGSAAGVERVGRRAILGIGLSVVGIALVVYGTTSNPATGASHSTVAGLAMVFGGSACWVVFSVLLKPYANRVDPVRVGALTMTGGALFLALVSARALADVRWDSVPTRAWGAIVFSGLGSLVVAYLFWQRGVRVLGPTRTSTYSNLQPIVALLVAWLTLGEVPTPWQVTGAATIVAGVLLTRR